ncbi:NADPH-dependent F420 reductase, partial [Streptomyces vinaceus]|uniref:NADPH-dependent F420 reductase n=1 Tax=Streptomyces vinaceus TaxID=1960 RepID=UPI003687329C
MNTNTDTDTNMDIGILGAGNIGRPLGRHWVAAGHRVTFGSRDPGRLASFVEPLGERARAAAYAETAEASDVVLLAVPHPALDGLLRRLAGALAGKTVIDASSPIGVSDDGLFVSVLGAGLTQGSWTAEGRPGPAGPPAVCPFPPQLRGW